MQVNSKTDKYKGKIKFFWGIIGKFIIPLFIVVIQISIW